MSFTIKTIPQHASSFWRHAGLSYLQYLNVSTKVLRNCLKEPHRTTALARDNIFYNKAGQEGKKAPVTTLFTKKVAEKH